jgi:hypothetical protein
VVDYTTADQEGRAAPHYQSFCAVADIISKPEGLVTVKEYHTYVTNIYTVRVEKRVRFKLPAAHSVRIPAGEVQDFASLCPRACSNIRPQRE